MSLRVVVLFNVGPPFGGFRSAVRPGWFGLDYPQAFEALEEATERAYTLLAHYEPSSWPELGQREEPALVARFQAREIVLDFIGGPSEDGGAVAVARAWLPLRLWPLGGWVVYEGRRRAPDGTWQPMPPDELSQLW